MASVIQSLTGEQRCQPEVLFVRIVHGLQHMERNTPMISDVYWSSSGSLVVFISVPIKSEQGEVFRLIGGGIYAHEHGTLHTLLRDHCNRDGTYAYPVDTTKRIINHLVISLTSRIIVRVLCLDDLRHY